MKNRPTTFLFFAFLINALIFVRRETYESQIMIALLNNNFLKVIKNFAKKVHNDTKSQLSLKFVRFLVNEFTLIQLLSDFENAVLKKLIKYFRKEVKLRFIVTESFLTYDFAKGISNLIGYFSPLLRLCSLDCHVNVLYYEVFDKFLSGYYRQFIAFCDRIDSKNLKLVNEKIDKDLKSFTRQLENLRFDGSQKVHFKMAQIKRFMDSEDMDGVLACLLNMQVFFRKIADPKISDKLLRAKIYFPHNAIAFISSYIQKSLEEDTKQKLVRASLSKTFFNPYVFHFIYKMSKLTRACIKGAKRARSE